MIFFQKKITETYGVTMRESVFRILEIEFESVENSPGFAQLLGEH